MGLSSRIRHYLSIDESLPAAGQGALGIECREGDEAVLNLIQPLNDQTTFECVTAERAVCRTLNGGCSVPIGAYAEIKHDELVLHGLVANQDGKRIIRSRRAGKPSHADSIGDRVAHELLEQGADKILKEFR
jgi:hydroxymethylbilane synthase